MKYCNGGIISLCCTLNFSFSTLNSSVTFLHVSFSALVRVCMNCSPSWPSQFFLWWALSLHHLDHTFFFGVHLPPPFQNLTIPHTYLELFSQMLVDSILVQLALVYEVLLGCFFGMWLSGQVCLPNCFYHCCSCLNCLHDYHLHIFWICWVFFFYSKFVCPWNVCLLWSASVCLVETFTPGTM